MTSSVWFWQRIVSPHMAGLAEALARTGRPVTYVAEQPMSKERAQLGWKPFHPTDMTLQFVPNASAAAHLVAEAPADSIHISQGFRGNGVIGPAQNALRDRGLRQWIIMETVKESGALMRFFKQLEYARLIHRWRCRIEGVLAIGDSTPAWLADRGMPADHIVPFAYFLPDQTVKPGPVTSEDAPFRVLFVGRLIELKRIDTLIEAITHLSDFKVELAIVGAGPLELELRERARARLGDRVSWLGQRLLHEIPAIMATADCLVLPSSHDGWGAVVSEALMVGTPAICTSRCGVAGVVKASGHGGVFEPGNANALAGLLRRALVRGRLPTSERDELRNWARCLGAARGAVYLAEVLDNPKVCSQMPAPPWTSLG